MNTIELFLKLVVQLRTLQICSHQAHNICSRIAFFSDHSFLNDYYHELQDAYDSAAERNIGLYGQPNQQLIPILTQVTEKCKTFPDLTAKENKDLFVALLKLEEELQQLGDAYIKAGAPEGCKNLVAGFLDDSMSRMYKIKQRIK